MKRYLFFLLILISSGAISQTLSTEEKLLEDWIPSTIGDYTSEGIPLTLTMQSGDKPYIMSSKNYKKGASTLTIVIFDYLKNPELLKKYAATWSGTPQESDPQKRYVTTVEDFPAWQAFDDKQNVAQLYVNVRDRYLLYLSSTKGSIDFLKSVVTELKPRQLPQ